MIDQLAFWAMIFMSIVDDVHLDGGLESQLRIGKAINVVTRYGYLGISMRVIPFNENVENEKWLFKEPTRNVYKNLSDITENTEENEPGVFNGDFHMEFCDNRRQLYQAYFRDFTIDCMDKPWEAFTGSWYPDHAAKKLGTSAAFLQGNYSYVLVRVVRVREVGRLKVNIPLNQTFDSVVRERMDLVVPGNSSTVMKFTQTIGTHYISSYKTGNSLYQVFAYTRKNYIAMKERIKSKGIQNLMRHELYTFFVPTYAAHVGKVRSISANATIEEWARENLQDEYFPKDYTILMKLYGNRTLLGTLDNLLGNDALLQIHLRSLNVIFQEEPKKESWFYEILDNFMKLLEVNLPQY